MWELIAKNKRNSLIVLIVMFILMELLSIVIGYCIALEDGILWGAAAGFVIWALQSLTAYFFGDDIVLNCNMAVQVTPESSPQLYNVVEEMKIASGMQNMPEIYIVQDSALNAFATGIRPQKSAICVTSGLVEALNRDEIQGVIAHEMSHIINRDVLFMTFAGVMLGTITLLSDLTFRGTILSSRSNNSRNRKGGIGGGNPIIVLVLLLFAILAPILAKIFYFSISRKREYLADATAARLTRYPEGLASALSKIAGRPMVTAVNKITAPMFIQNPEISLDDDSVFSTSTHPPIAKRIAILRKLQGAGSVSLVDYQNVYMKENRKSSFLPKSALQDNGKVSVRSASETKEDQLNAAKAVSDMLLVNGGFTIFQCECGLKIKLPPTAARNEVKCPRCGRIQNAPDTAEVRTSEGNEEKEFVFVRKDPNSWESFTCPCGNFVFHISPMFKSTYAVCRRCRAKVRIEYPS